jgi:hypothetical protein
MKYSVTLRTLPDTHRPKFGKAKWTPIVNRAEKNRANFREALDGMRLFSAFYGMYAVTMNWRPYWRWVHRQHKVMEWTKPQWKTAQDDNFQEVKRCKRYISNNTSQTARKSTKSVSTSAAVKLPPKAVLTHTFALLRTTDMDTEVLAQRTHYQRRLPENQAGYHQ